MSASAGRTTLRLPGAGDAAVIQRWLRQPEVAAWWGSTQAAAAEIRIASESASALVRIVDVDGVAVGYAHALDWELTGAPRPVAVESGTYLLALVIAERQARGRGVGGEALELLAREVEATTLAPAAALMVPVRHEAAVRTAERAGFRWLSVWQDPLRGAVWIMIRQRGIANHPPDSRPTNGNSR